MALVLSCHAESKPNDPGPLQTESPATMPPEGSDNLHKLEYDEETSETPSSQSKLTTPEVPGNEITTGLINQTASVTKHYESAPTIPYSPGDQIRLLITGVGSDQFAGDYLVNLNYELDIPYTGPFNIKGLTAATLKTSLSELLVERQFLREGSFNVSVQTLSYAPINVTVTGAVFEPGRVLINESQDTGKGDSLVGDSSMGKYLTSALLAAGGVTPRADVKAILLKRPSGEEFSVDLSGLFDGLPIADIPLVTGDIIHVPDSGVFQANIVRPSPITPAEVATYVSNVTEPIAGRSTLESSDRVVNETLFSYGTRLTQAVIAAQCAGGTRLTNSSRKILYVHTNQATGEVSSVERSVNSVILNTNQTPNSGDNSSDNHPDNPYLMPRDGIICYDSSLVSIREIFNTMATVLVPANIWQSIIKD